MPSCIVSYLHYIHQIETIQHHATRFVLNRPWKHYHYDSISDMYMLTSLNWPSLQLRRKNARFPLFTSCFIIIRLFLRVTYPLKPKYIVNLTIHSSYSTINHPIMHSYKFSFSPELFLSGMIYHQIKLLL